VTTSTQSRRSGIIFITATDTGVGKSLVTGLLLHHLRSEGVQALAMKPFCCGGTTDLRLLRGIQGHELEPAEISPFYYEEPLAPLVAGRKHRHNTTLAQAVSAVRGMRSRCQCLLVEGIGGLLVPLGEGFSVRDLIAALDCEVLVIARNRVGTINHTRLTVNALHDAGIWRIKVVLSGVAGGDPSSRSNLGIIEEMTTPHPVISIPFLGRNASTIAGIKRNVGKLKKSLAWISDFDSFSPPFGQSVKAVSKKQSLK
jgi:dethiobiotin synthetase